MPNTPVPSWEHAAPTTVDRVDAGADQEGADPQLSALLSNAVDQADQLIGESFDVETSLARLRDRLPEPSAPANAASVQPSPFHLFLVTSHAHHSRPAPSTEGLTRLLTLVRGGSEIGTFTWQGRDFGAWLVTIARNLVADHFKSSRFRLEVTTGEMLDSNETERSPKDAVLESLSNAALLDAVHRLNPQQQECLTLRFLQGLSVAETARIMGKNEDSIKTLQQRAVRALSRLLPPDDTTPS